MKLSISVRLHREAHGWSLAYLARRTGYSKSHIWEIEHGNSVNPTINFVKALASAFGVSMSALLDDNVEKPRIPAHLATAISSVMGIEQRAYERGFQVGRSSVLEAEDA